MDTDSNYGIWDNQTFEHWISDDIKEFKGGEIDR